jgi:Tol biopolymer transport system component
MTVHSGTRLGPYEVVSRIGAGGMGEVFKARDTRLDRSVAVKILPADFSKNAQLRLRFEREAKAISQLSHPHICTLHDVGSEGGVNFLVMELLEGESLADRLTKGPLPMAEVIRYGAQIADALAVAHRRNIVHRDLKPGNIMLTRSGAKLLDFGLAKVGPAISNPEETTAAAGATEHKPLTERGTILGTFQYMAPEQLEGVDADARTDIFAFGAVLYEMATGHRAFTGKNKTSLIASIVSAQPRPLREMQPLTPPVFEHLVDRCLAKDPDERWQNAQDIAEQLRWISEAGSSAGVAAPIVRQRKGREQVAWVLAAVLAVAGGVATWRSSRHAPARPVQRTAIVTADDITVGDSFPALAITPDGSAVILRSLANENNPPQLYLRRLSTTATQPLAGSIGARSPFISPDGKWVGFFADSQLRKIPIDGGSPTVLTAANVPRGGTWGTDGYIYYAPEPQSGIWRVPENGGKAEEVTRPDPAQGENSHRWPQLLPGGKHLLVTIRPSTINSFDDGKIGVLDLVARKWTVILTGGSHARYAPTGHLLFGRANALYAVAFDPEELKVEGTPQRVVDGVSVLADSGAAQYDLSSRGSLVYLTAAGRKVSGVLASFDGSAVRQISQDAKPIYSPRVSPDGRFIAVRFSLANDDIFIYDVARDAYTRLTFEPGDEWDPVWSPDGRKIYYAWSPSHGDQRLVTRPADGSGEPRVLAKDTLPIIPGSISADGKWLVARTATPETKGDITLFSLVDGARRELVKTPFDEYQPRFSPDGRWIAYVSEESGTPQVYIRATQPGGGKWQISKEDGFSPLWAPDGRVLYFASKTRSLRRVAIATNEHGVQASVPVAMFTPPRMADAPDVGPDGTFIAPQRSDANASREPIQYVENWFTELTARVPQP